MPKIATGPKSSATVASRRTVASVARPAVIRIGYVPLVDASPLIVAEAMGFFEKAGLAVKLSQELGWGTVREKVVFGELDATHAPGGLLFSILFGTHTPPCPVATDCVLNLQGNAITLSRRLWQKGVRDGQTLKLMIRSEAPQRPVLAVVSPFSSHHFLLRKWLRESGIDPDRDVRIAILPPPLVGEHMNSGHIDGFCVGEPWNSAAALAGDGWVVATSEALDPLHPEKILVARHDLFGDRPEEYSALRAALVRACAYCDKPENRREIAGLLYERQLFSCSREALENSLIGPFSTGMGALSLKSSVHVFSQHDANAVTSQRAAWFLDAVLESGSLRLDAQQKRVGLDAFRESLVSPARKGANKSLNGK